MALRGGASLFNKGSLLHSYMNYHKLKCLPFDMWGAWRLFQGELTPDEMFQTYEVIPAIIGKPGRYYDRESRVCWTELPDGRAYKVDPAGFLRELELAWAEERPLRQEEREAIRTLLVYNNGPVPQELRRRLYLDDHVRHLRETFRSARQYNLVSEPVREFLDAALELAEPLCDE